VRDAGHCVDSVRLDYVELVQAAYFGATGVYQFCGGWWAAEDDEHVPFLDYDVMLFGDLASRDKASA
jgi:hypothetical protein